MTPFSSVVRGTTSTMLPFAPGKLTPAPAPNKRPTRRKAKRKARKGCRDGARTSPERSI